MVKDTSYIEAELMKETIRYDLKNNFTDFLSNLPDWDYGVSFDLAQKYHIGTSNHFGGKSTIFWQVDINKKLRSGKIIQYNPQTGKRVKKPFNHINWMHKVKKIEDFNLKQCLFGEHLLASNKEKPVAIVESEKTAVICSVLLPDFLWLACGSVNNLNKNMTAVLKGRNVVLFPDANCYDLWYNKIDDLTKLATFRISTLLRDKSTTQEKENGLDIADYLINLDWRKFRETLNNNTEVEQNESDLDIFKVNKTIENNEVEDDTSFYDIFKTENPQEEEAKWDEDINNLENFFKTFKLPEKPLKLNQCSTILNVQKFVNSHLLVVKAQNGNNTFLPYLERLQKLRSILD